MNYDTKVPSWRNVYISKHYQHPFHVCTSEKMPSFPLYHSEAFHFFSFLKRNLSAQLLPHHTFHLSWKTLFSPNNAVEMPRLYFFIKISLGIPKRKRKEFWYNDIIAIPISTKSVIYSQQSKCSLKYIYFNKDISRTICLSLLQCVFLKTCPKMQEFRLASFV